MSVPYVTSDARIAHDGVYVTNYERVVDFDPKRITAVVLGGIGQTDQSAG